MTDTKTDLAGDYAARLIAKAEAGDWREVLADVVDAAHQHRDAARLFQSMGSELIRDMQAAYAAGVLHGPAACLDWIGNTLDGPGNCPTEPNPDPTWFRAHRSGEKREVPANCATVIEPGTAPSTNPRPGITGLSDVWSIQDDAGEWWDVDGGSWGVPAGRWMLRVDEPGGTVLDGEQAEVLGGALTRLLEADDWTVLVQVDIDDRPVMVDISTGPQPAPVWVFKRAGQWDELVYVNPAVMLAVTANRPADAGDFWTHSQSGDWRGAVRMSSAAGGTWGFVMPLHVGHEMPKVAS